jgi:ribosomal protein S18 acetylase RimI-like enzyme
MDTKVSTLHVAATRDENRVVGAITVAFAADPAMRWLYPDPLGYVTSFPKLVRAFGRSAFEHGSVHEVSNFAGAAIWLPPGIVADNAALGRVIENTVDAERVPRVFEVLGQLDRHHPTESHWYLPFVGVDAPQQRRGLGSLLLSHALAQVDREHSRAYLETANPANIPLYQRHGFQLVGRIEVSSAPVLYPMVRPAK